MSIIDTLILDPTNAETHKQVELLIAAGRLTERQASYAKAIIANPAIVADKTKAAEAELAEKMEATRAAGAKAHAERVAREAEQAQGLTEGQRVALTSKKKGRREGEVLWVEAGSAAIRIDGVDMAVVVQIATADIEVI